MTARTITMDELCRDEAELQSRRPGGRDMVCSNCAYLMLNKTQSEKFRKEIAGGTDNTLFSDVRGECRRYAPRPLQSIVSRSGQLIGAIAWAIEETAGIEHDETQDYGLEGSDLYEVDEWPLVSVNDWCGDFVQRTKPLLAEKKEDHEEAVP